MGPKTFGPCLAVFFIAGLAVISLLVASSALGQSIPGADLTRLAASHMHVFVPKSSAEQGFGFNHTNYVILGRGQSNPAPQSAPDFLHFETPASLGCVYAISPIYPGCNPALGRTRHPSGGWGAIAIVDAYDNPDADSDIAYFSDYYHLPHANFTKVFANGNGGCDAPAPDRDWAIEEALDIEWAHAMAPAAEIYLVEACSGSDTDLYYAEEVATDLVNAAGGGDISNSWGESEFPGEDAWDRYFYISGAPISYFASSGDQGGVVLYPSASPFVVSSGGSVINRDSEGNFISESCWPSSGGGPSAYENAQPSQAALTIGARWTPDISSHAQGVNVFDFYNGGWFVIAGTSVSAPTLAGIVNNANSRLGEGVPGTVRVNQEDVLIYSQLGTSQFTDHFFDITLGSNGYPATPGYDWCTGLGSPRGKYGK